MARPREFELEKAIADATAVFWTHGYGDSSLPLLLEGTDLSRGSLYKAFSGKEQLFITALRYYAENEVMPVGVMLADPAAGDGFQRIKTAFMNIPNSVRNGDTRGCLLCSAAAGRAVQEPEIAKVIHELLNAMEDGFKIALAAAGQNHRGIGPLLVAQYIGLRTLARSGTDADVLELSIKAIMEMLERPTKANGNEIN